MALILHGSKVIWIQSIHILEVMEKYHLALDFNASTSEDIHVIIHLWAEFQIFQMS